VQYGGEIAAASILQNFFIFQVQATAFSEAAPEGKECAFASRCALLPRRGAKQDVKPFTLAGCCRLYDRRRERLGEQGRGPTQQQETTMSNVSIIRGSLFAIALPFVFAITSGSALADCKTGYVWREARPNDFVCVTPAQRSEAKAQNANGPNNVQPGGGALGPTTCRQGYVWREAWEGDTVCVTPTERQEAKNENAANASHTN
jgi:hypothetical protein